MKMKFLTHILSICVVSVVLLFSINHIKQARIDEKNKVRKTIEPYLESDFIDLNNPFSKALFFDVLNIYRPNQMEKNKELIERIENYTIEDLTIGADERYTTEELTSKKIQDLLGMFVKFLIVYCFVIFLTYYGVHTLGVYRFLRYKRKRMGERSTKNKFLRIMFSVGKYFGYIVLFSPAYVIAYSIKGTVSTDNIVFMILLAVLSNGLLITYTHRFFTFLLSESRKGFIKTAVVKNLNNSYRQDVENGISWAQVFSLKKSFKGHVFDHIYQNARHQYFSTIKEQASFLITGIIIIEMALNLQGFLSYELLKQILYRNYDIVIFIILGIFYIVKLTDILTDILVNYQQQKYVNK